MKNIARLVVLILVASISLHAQGLRASVTSNFVTLSWTSTTPGAAVLIQRAPCPSVTITTTEPDGATIGTCASPGSFAALATVPVGTTYTDNTVGPATSYAYQIAASCTAACPSGISGTSAYVPTPALGVTTGTITPPPPTNPTITAMNVAPSGTCCVTIATTWTDSNPSTTYMLFNQNGVLKSGYLKPSSNSNYTLNWKGLPFQIVTARFVVCDLQGCVNITIPPVGS